MAETNAQSGILDPLPPLGRYLSFRLVPEQNPRDALTRLAQLADGVETVVGIGPSTVARLGAKIPNLHEAPSYEGALQPVPATPRALWLWLRGSDRGELLHRGQRLTTALEQAFELESVVDGFRHREGRDLTGYIDGTENPTGDDALEAALVADGKPGLPGSSMVAVQSWSHDLKRFDRYPAEEQDHIIGRRRADNVELEDAPESSHVKRTAPESFSPEAFMLRRSMPWLDGLTSGLMFVAFGSSFYSFEAQLKRMVGLEDGITDGLFRFSRILATSYYWCPPVDAGRLDLRALGIG
ncbi:MAG: Dyp-type peroxidase [Myxococcales bacterium]